MVEVKSCQLLELDDLTRGVIYTPNADHRKRRGGRVKPESCRTIGFVQQTEGYMIQLFKRKVLKIVDGHIPQRLQAEEPTISTQNELLSARVAIVFSFALSAMCFVMFITRVVLEGSSSKGIWLLPLVSILLILTLYISKWFQNYAVLSHIFLLFGLTVIPYRAWSTGGIDSTVSAWFLLIPIVAGLIGNSRLRFPAMIVAFLELIIVTYPGVIGLEPTLFEPQKAVQLSVLIVLMLFVSFLVWIYQDERHSQLVLLGERASQIRILSGLLRICSSCKKIHDKDDDDWKQMELYIDTHSEAQFSHGFCPECLEKEYRKIGLAPPK